MGHRLRTTLILILAFCATLVVSSITFGALAPTLDPGDAEGPWYSAMSTGNPMLDLVILLVFGIPFGCIALMLIVGTLVQLPVTLYRDSRVLWGAAAPVRKLTRRAGAAALGIVGVRRAPTVYDVEKAPFEGGDEKV